MKRMIPLLLLACAPKIDVGPTLAEVVEAPATVVEMPDESAMGVYLQAAIASGSAWDPVGKEGLAALTARSLVSGGAGSHTGPELEALLYENGADLDLVVDKEWVTLRLGCHPDAVDTCIEVFGDLLMRPTFEPEAVERKREEARQALDEGMLENIERLGGVLLDTWLYEAHPYGHPVTGRTGALPVITVDDVRDFHRAHYVRTAITAGIAGAASEAQLTRFRELTGALPASTNRLGAPVAAPELPLQKPLPVAGRELLAVQVDGDATGFHLGHPTTLERSHEDWPAVHLALTHFGAHRQSFGRLFQALRAARGLNYGDYAYVEPYTQRPGAAMPEQGTVRRQPYFSIWLRPTTLENGPFALKLAIDQLETLVAEGLSEEEVAATRAYLSRRGPLEAATADRRLAYAIEAAATGQPDPQQTLATRLEGLTAIDVNEAIKRHLRPDDLRIVAVSGDAEGLIAKLIEETETSIVYAGVTPTEAQAAHDARVAKSQLELTQATAVSATGIFR
ncbi:MAG: insulinase family protein [Proteobacteria bacterium]|nr:insulinase family protein [Pseudomonadota bacterium]